MLTGDGAIEEGSFYETLILGNLMDVMGRNVINFYANNDKLIYVLLLIINIKFIRA